MAINSQKLRKNLKKCFCWFCTYINFWHKFQVSQPILPPNIHFYIKIIPDENLKWVNKICVPIDS